MSRRRVMMLLESASNIVSRFIERVSLDGGTLDNQVGLSSVDESSALTMLPNAYKNGTLYSVLPEDGTGDFDVVRGSSATRVDASGLIGMVSSNAPRIDYTDGTPSLLTEPQSTNLIVNSELNNVENIVVSAVSHTISFYGTGSITLSGTHTDTLVGTGASDRVSLTFTPTAGTLICTDSGSVDKKQVEALSHATSYIPTNGAIATRLEDKVTGAGDATTFNSTEGVLYFEGRALLDANGNRWISLTDGTTSNYVILGFMSSTGLIQAFVNGGGQNSVMPVGGITKTDVNKIAVRWSSSEASIWVNGSVRNTSARSSSLSGLSQLDLGFNNSNELHARTKDLRVYPTALSDAELTTLTTI